MNEAPEPSLRSVIDELALQVAQSDANTELPELLSAKTLTYIAKLRKKQPTLTGDEIDRITTVIIEGVLRRLKQIAEGGGQIGSA